MQHHTQQQHYDLTHKPTASPSKYDAIVGNSSLYGHANMSDAVAHDDTWAFRRYGPVSRLTLYKAWYYDGAWHDPGEFKGIQAWWVQVCAVVCASRE